MIKRLFQSNKNYFINAVEDLPDNIDELKVYIVGEKGYEWQIVFKCPCGCRELIQLNLLKDANPCWKTIRHNDGTFSISPSVHRKIKCRSHFTIRKSRIIWYRNYK